MIKKLVIIVALILIVANFTGNNIVENNEVNTENLRIVLLNIGTQFAHVLKFLGEVLEEALKVIRSRY